MIPTPRVIVCSNKTLARDTARILGWPMESLRIVERPSDMNCFKVEKLILMENWWLARDLRQIIDHALALGLKLEYVQSGLFDITWDEVKDLNDEQIRVYGDIKYLGFIHGLTVKTESFKTVNPNHLN